MARTSKNKSPSNSSKPNGATLGFEATLWAAADKMRGHMDSGEYMHVALGIIFLKYISDAFEELHTRLTTESKKSGADTENKISDWTVKENVQANLRRPVRRILRKYGYPPDLQQRATQTVMEQAAVLGAEWAS